MTDDNERQAATLKVGISNYVGTATLAVIAGAVALFTYVQQNFSPSIPFYVAMVLAVGALVVSIILGGRGANSTAMDLAKGTWTKDTKTRTFNFQAVLSVVGMLLVLVAAVFGTTSPHRVPKDPCVSILSTELSRAHPNIRQLRQELATCQATVKSR